MQRLGRRLTGELMSLMLMATAGAAEPGERLLNGFEGQQELRRWEISSGRAVLTTNGVTQGSRALELQFDPAGRYGAGYLTLHGCQDWSGYETLLLDVHNPGERPMAASLLVGDRAWQEKNGSYWNRHNSSVLFPPGTTTWRIPLGGLYRGEAGSRNNDIRANIDVSSIVRLDFGFGRTGQHGVVLLDNLRLARGSRPANVRAFDFGPPQQSVMPGWQAVSHDTAYDARQGYGWGRPGGCPWQNAARDTTFGPALIRDFCEAGGYRFTVSVPPGPCTVTVIYENSGYWGGEQARHAWRRIRVGEQEVWREDRPDGPAHALYRFEHIEPIGVDVWDTYMRDEVSRVFSFAADAGPDGLTLRFDADVTWGSKLAALVVHPRGDAACEQWVREQMQAVADAFRSMAVCLDPPSPAWALPPGAEPLGFTAWPVSVEADVTPTTVPAGPVPPLRLSATAAAGSTATFAVAVRSPSELLLGATYRTPDGLTGTVEYVSYGLSRGFNQVAYRTAGDTVRPVGKGVRLPGQVTRQLLLTVPIPAASPPGVRHGVLRLAAIREPVPPFLDVPVTVDVRPVVLDRATPFRFGYFGLEPPQMLPRERRESLLEETLNLLAQCGMNQLSGGPDLPLTGWRDGQPIIDFAACDRFFERIRAHGFTGPHNGYGGLRLSGLHDGYTAGRSGAKAEADSGLPFAEAVRRCWEQVAAHARQRQWPTLLYAMCDETRVVEKAEAELAFMRVMAPVSAAMPDVLRTCGSYSVSFSERPDDSADVRHWHQRFFEALDVSSLNNHDSTVLDEARRIGKEVQIYNQGTSRYSFGMYQWSEYRKGISARTQWHLNALHGYAFFDLDGREPDHSMILYGRDGLRMRPALVRCRQGAEDFYLYNTLWKRIAQRRASGGETAALDDATRLLEDAVSRIRLNDRRQPEWFDADRFNADVLDAIERLK